MSPYRPPDMSLDEAAALLLRDFRDDPSRIVTRGFCRLISAYTVNEHGEYVDVAPGKEIKSWYTPSHNQQRFIDYRKVCQKKQHPVDAIVLKPRFIGATTDIQCDFTARTAMRSGVWSLTVAHQTGPDQGIYRTQKGILEELPEWARPSYVNDASRLTRLKNDRIGLRDSGSACLSSTSITKAHSARYLLLHLSELARFENHAEVEQALGALLFKTPESQFWRESTAWGHDPLFHPLFMDAWKAQGCANYWQKGHKLFASGTTAFFFAGYQDQGKRLALEVDQADLRKDLDSYENELLRQNILPYWTREMGLSPDQAMLAGLEYLWWRRGKIPFFYRNFRPSVPVGSTYSNIVWFHRQEPNTIDEAFEVSAGMRVFSDEDLEWMKSTVREPVREGLIVGNDFVNDPSRKFVRIWREPNEDMEVIAACDPAGGTANLDECRTDREPNWNIDFTYCVLIDANTGEQIAEYCSQAPQHVACTHVWDLIMWYRRRGADKFTPDRWPRVSWESQVGKMMTEVCKIREYPLSRIVHRTHEDRMGREGDLLYGWYKSKSATIAAVQLLQGRIADRTLIVRSRRLYEQAANFQEKGGDKYEAAHKGQGGKGSKDDGISAMMQLCHANNYGRPPRAPIFDSDQAGTKRKVFRPDDLSTLSNQEYMELYKLAWMRGLDRPEDLPTKPGRGKPKEREILC